MNLNKLMAEKLGIDDGVKPEEFMANVNSNYQLNFKIPTLNISEVHIMEIPIINSVSR